MKVVHRLNGHSLQETATALASFFEGLGMKASVDADGGSGVVVRAEKGGGLLSGGDNKSCTVRLEAAPGQNLVVNAGSGLQAWGDKVVTGAALAAAAASGAILGPLTGPLIAVAGGNLACEVHDQATLPRRADDFILEYLSGNS